MTHKTKSIAPEVEHLLAAVKAVKRGLIPEMQKQPANDAEITEGEEEHESNEERV